MLKKLIPSMPVNYSPPLYLIDEVVSYPVLQVLKTAVKAKDLNFFHKKNNIIGKLLIIVLYKVLKLVC